MTFVIGVSLIWFISVFADCPVKISNITVSLSGSFRQVYRGTDEDSIFETTV